jgi:hypothetical protein
MATTSTAALSGIGDETSDAVSAALNRTANRSAPAGRNRWRVSYRARRGFEGCASLIDDWLVLEAAAGRRALPGGDRRRQLCRLLERNAELDGGSARWILARDGSIRVRAEIPDVRALSQRPESLERRLGAGIRDIAAALDRAKRAAVPETTEISPAGGDSVAGLEALCREAGWNTVGHVGGGLKLELKGGEPRQAVAVAFGKNVVLAVEVLTHDDQQVPEHGHHAIASLMLRAAGAVRLAKPVRRVSQSSSGLEFNVALPEDPSPPEVSAALASLSVAADLVGDIPEMLADDPILARIYLEYRFPVRGLPKKLT